MKQIQRRSLWKFGLAAGAIAALLTTTACGPQGGVPETKPAAEAPESSRKADNTLVLQAQQDPGTLDYVNNNQTALILWIPGNVVEPLLTMDPDGNPQPGIAENWEVSEDQKSYVFTIRDTTFSDGSPVTAKDVVFSLNEMKNSPIVTYSAPYAAVTEIAATGDNEVTVTLSRPSQAFAKGMGGMSALIQPEAAAKNRATAPIGTGPYVLDSYKTDAGFKFSANPSYWGEKPQIGNVEVRIIPDGTSAMNALQAGEIDAMPVITIDLWERLAQMGLDKTFTMETYPQVGEMLYATFNTTQAPYTDKKVRQALAQSFNRDDIAKAFNAPFGADATCGYGLQNTSWWAEENDASCPYPTDPEAVADQLKSAGVADDTLEFTSLSDVPDLSLPADVMIGQLESANVKVERNAIELARYAQTIFQGRPPQFGITVMSDPASITQFVCTDEAQMGWTTYCNPEFAKLVTAADSAKTTEESADLMAQANEVLKEDAVIVPLLAKSGVGLFHPELKGWEEPRIMVDIRFANLHW